MAIRYSVIIPTFNRADQLLLTLVSLDRADYLKDQYEIIVVDDGSTDGTKELISGFQTAVPLTYLSNDVQRGRSVTRNLGLRHAKGLYVVFCDADFIVLPDFFQVLDRCHRKYPRSVLSGIPYSWGDAYTHYHPDFSAEEKLKCREVLSQAGVWLDEWETAGHIVPLLKPDDLVNQTGRLTQLVAPNKMTSQVSEQFARTDVAPWLKLITRCVSIKRSYLTRSGGFNEQFVKYGLEDWDLGYRLHRMKIRFHSIKRVLGYHQEHPNVYRGDVTNNDNLRVMYTAYGFRDHELNLFALLPAWKDVETYKHTLRVIRRGLRSKTGRSPARLIKSTLRASAKHWMQHSSPQQYTSELHTIRVKLRASKRRGQTAKTLIMLLDKSADLLKPVENQ